MKRRTGKPDTSQRRVVVPKQTFTDGSNLSVRERLRRVRRESIEALRVIYNVSTQLSSQTEQYNILNTDEADLKYKKSLNWKVQTIKNKLERLSEEQEKIFSGITRDYEREQAQLLCNMDQVQRITPTYLNVAGMITSPNQLVQARKAKVIQENKGGQASKRRKVQ